VELYLHSTCMPSRRGEGQLYFNLVVVVAVVVVVVVVVVSAVPNVFCFVTRDVPRSTPGKRTGSHKTAFRYFFQYILTSAATANQIWYRPLPSSFFPIRRSLCILSFHATQSELRLLWPSKLSGYCTYRQFNIQQLYVLPTHCFCVFCVDLRTSSDYFPIQHQLVGFCNRDGECLLRGTT